MFPIAVRRIYTEFLQGYTKCSRWNCCLGAVAQHNNCSLQSKSIRVSTFSRSLHVSSLILVTCLLQRAHYTASKRPDNDQKVHGENHAQISRWTSSNLAWWSVTCCSDALGLKKLGCIFCAICTFCPAVGHIFTGVYISPKLPWNMISQYLTEPLAMHRYACNFYWYIFDIGHYLFYQCHQFHLYVWVLGLPYTQRLLQYRYSQLRRFSVQQSLSLPSLSTMPVYRSKVIIKDSSLWINH